MCSRCHKRMAVVFVTKIENGEKVSEGICMKCAKELGLPVENMLGNVFDKLGMTPEQLENMEQDINDMIAENGGLPSDNDDNEDGGAPAIDFPKLIRESGLLRRLLRSGGSRGKRPGTCPSRRAQGVGGKAFPR